MLLTSSHQAKERERKFLPPYPVRREMGVSRCEGSFDSVAAQSQGMEIHVPETFAVKERMKERNPSKGRQTR